VPWQGTHNNVAERALRRVAVGRKNWLFAGHDESGMGQAILWSLIASAQRHKIDVQFYLRRVLAYLPAVSLSNLPTLSGSREELKDYLPDAWKRDLMTGAAVRVRRPSRGDGPRGAY
jgi:hypothetical protein